VLLSAELDLLELTPFYSADSAFAPSVALERRARTLGAEHLQKRAQLIQADVLGRKGKLTASGQLIREINAWAETHGDPHLLARSHRLLSMFFDSIGDVPSSWEHAVRAVELVDDSMSDRLRADHLIGLGVVLVRTGAYDAARERYRAALQLAEDLNDVQLRLKILNNLAWLEDDAGDPHQAMEIAWRMQAFAARHDVALDAACLDTIAHAQVVLGRYVEAEHTLRPILDDADLESRESEGLTEALKTAASAQRLQGHAERAQATLDRCLRLCEERGISAIRVEALEQQALLYAAQGQFQRAYEEYIEFHSADAMLRAAEREANARTLQAVFETAEARREGARFRELALRDALTGLCNRRYVDTELRALQPGRAAGSRRPEPVRGEKRREKPGRLRPGLILSGYHDRPPQLCWSAPCQRPIASEASPSSVTATTARPPFARHCCTPPAPHSAWGPPTRGRRSSTMSRRSSAAPSASRRRSRTATGTAAGST